MNSLHSNPRDMPTQLSAIVEGVPSDTISRSGSSSPNRSTIDREFRLVSAKQFAEVVQRIQQLTTGDGTTRVTVSAWWQGELRWARNRITLASERRDYTVRIQREEPDGRSMGTTTNQLDVPALKRVMSTIDRKIQQSWPDIVVPTMEVPKPTYPVPKTTIWSDATLNTTSEQRGALSRALVERAEYEKMLSAGYVEMSAREGQSITLHNGEAGRNGNSTNELVRKFEQQLNDNALRWTEAQCSMTVRDPQGQASGWAGLSSFDWRVVDAPVLAERALAKCLASLNPVRIEPGRYTVILEPQAVASLTDILMSNRPQSRTGAEQGSTPFSLEFDAGIGLWRSKLGLKIIDERITISHDPTDIQQGVHVNDNLAAVEWVKNGVLQSLAHSREYALRALTRIESDQGRQSYHVSGGNSTLDDMIGSTQRGLLVTRFSTVRLVDGQSLLATGLTRDGLWLVENGKISKAVRNMRFTESPLFVLNQVEQLGVPVPVFRPGSPHVRPAIVPPLKVKDFSFTSTIDAI